MSGIVNIDPCITAVQRIRYHQQHPGCGNIFHLFSGEQHHGKQHSVQAKDSTAGANGSGIIIIHCFFQQRYQASADTGDKIKQSIPQMPHLFLNHGTQKKQQEHIVKQVAYPAVKEQCPYHSAIFLLHQHTIHVQSASVIQQISGKCTYKKDCHIHRHQQYADNGLTPQRPQIHRFQRLLFLPNISCRIKSILT